MELAQFQIFQRFLANQEEAGRSTDDSSNDTWQDILPPTSSIGDSRPDLAMTEPARTQPARTQPARTHTNCPLCRQPPNIIGHKLKNYPILLQHGLRLPDTLVNPPSNESSNPTTEPPPSSSPTIENNSIL